jgi:hypothetical protein
MGNIGEYIIRDRKFSTQRWQDCGLSLEYQPLSQFLPGNRWTLYQNLAGLHEIIRNMSGDTMPQNTEKWKTFPLF